VIPTREAPVALERCAASILDADYPPTRLELVVVDSAPVTDRTADTVRHLEERYPDAHIQLLRDERGGAARARNLGLRSSESPFVVFADGDVVVRRSWLIESLGAFEWSPDIGCVTGLVLPLQLDTRAQLLFQEFGGYGKGFSPIVYHVDDPPAASPLFPYQAGVFGTGASMAFRRDVLLELGGMDEALGPGTPTRSGDDSELLLRTILRGVHLAYNPRAVVWHPDEATMEGLYEQVRGYGVGLGAYLTRTALSDPRHALAITRRFAAGAGHLIQSGSKKNTSRTSEYPRGLTAAELVGVARGPWSYFRSRRRQRL